MRWINCVLISVCLIGVVGGGAPAWAAPPPEAAPLALASLTASGQPGAWRATPTPAAPGEDGDIPAVPDLPPPGELQDMGRIPATRTPATSNKCVLVGRVRPQQDSTTLARQDLAKRLGVQAASVRLVSVKKVWEDALAERLPPPWRQSDRVYRGPFLAYHIRLSVKGVTYDYYAFKVWLIYCGKKT